MEKQPWLFDDEPEPSEGPDYVALVIEWDDLADELEDELENQIAAPEETSAPAAPVASPMRTSRLVKIAGAVGALALAVWGLRMLRS